MSAPNLGKCPVRVLVFENGDQGSTHVLEETERVVYETSAIFPQEILCAARPLKRRTYHYIEYGGARWPVKWAHERTPSRWLPEGRRAAYELYLPHNWRDLASAQPRRTA